MLVIMARWEPNAKERLVIAALELFDEQGYDATTVSQIAERAGGLTKTTFFRHFPDKREVLFAAGQEIHGRIVADAIAAAPDAVTPLAAVAAALDALTATFGDERRAFCARLLTVIAASSELRERSVAKHAALAEAMTDALRRRGVADPAAGLAADLGVRAWERAFAQWATAVSPEPFPELARRALGELRSAMASLA
jgi:AcrR family transcriptional regulator